MKSLTELEAIAKAAGQSDTLELVAAVRELRDMIDRILNENPSRAHPEVKSYVGLMMNTKTHSDAQALIKKWQGVKCRN